MQRGSISTEESQWRLLRPPPPPYPYPARRAVPETMTWDDVNYTVHPGTIPPPAFMSSGYSTRNHIRQPPNDLEHDLPEPQYIMGPEILNERSEENGNRTDGAQSIAPSIGEDDSFFFPPVLSPLDEVALLGPSPYFSSSNENPPFQSFPAALVSPVATPSTPAFRPYSLQYIDNKDREVQRTEGLNGRGGVNKLKILLDKRADLNLAGRVYNISVVQQDHGGYSDIFTGYYTPANGVETKVAVKRLRVHIIDDKSFQNKLAKELYIWSRVRHPRILPLEGFYIEDNNYPSLVSRWVENGTVLKYLQNRPDTNILELAIGIAEGVDYLHSNGIVHSDIKPDNILMSESGQPLLCDFGIARILEESKTMTFGTSTYSLHGTYRYMAKEILEPADPQLPTYTKASDVWAFGMTVITLLTRKPPYPNLRNDAQVISAIMRGELPSRPADIHSWPFRYITTWSICEAVPF